MSTTQADPTAFVASLTLPPPGPGAKVASPQLGLGARDTAPPPAVVGNTLMAFTAEVSPQHQMDVLNSVGFAQLAINSRGIDAGADPADYYSRVISLLSGIGYSLQPIDFSEFTTTTQTVEIDKAVLEIMARVVIPPELEIIDDALKALQASANTGGASWQIYSGNSTSSYSRTFAVGLVNEVNGNVTLQLSAFHLVGSEADTKFLWMTYPAPSVHIQDGQVQLALNDSKYAQVRAAIQQKMDGHLAGYIAAVTG